MKWCIDIDGVITANPAVFGWLTYHLTKNENNQTIIILSWRDGSDPERVKETEKELEEFGIRYNQLVMAPRRFPNARVAMFWKIAKIAELEVDIWLDDEIKSYKRDYSINLDRLLPGVQKIWI